MRIIRLVILLVSSFMMLFYFGCYPDYKVTLIEQSSITDQEITEIESPSKAFLFDGSIIIFPTGFLVQDNQIKGKGEIYYYGKAPSPDTISVPTEIRIPLDSIAAITYYEDITSGGKQFSSFLLGLTGGILLPLSLYCITCPKCCFGSCPTVYTNDGSQFNFEAELFSSSISKLLEKKDLDFLSQELPENGMFQLRITNEALETHHINHFSLLVVEHPSGTQAYPSNLGNFLIVKNLSAPDEAVNSEKVDMLNMLRTIDNTYYRSGPKMVEQIKNGLKFDWIALRKNVPGSIDSATLVIRYRNTLLSTILLYDVLLASQGIEAIDWIARMNNDTVYASQFDAVYKQFSGLKVQTKENGKWHHVSNIQDAGPLAWKFIAVEVPVHNGELNIRLKFLPDNFMIDYIGVDSGPELIEPVSIDQIRPSSIEHNTLNSKEQISESIEQDDHLYLTTNPGDMYILSFKILKKEKISQSIFIESKGYYTEWIRGNWITVNNQGYKFDLFNILDTLTYLADSWILNREELEREFFKTRIPIREER